MLYLPVRHKYLVEDCPSIHISGSLRGMKKLYWGKTAKVVRCGSYYYNISNLPVEEIRKIEYLSKKY